VAPGGTAVGDAVGVAVGELQPMARAVKTINSIISAFLYMVSIIGTGFISIYPFYRLSLARNRRLRPGRA
jgi:hypothetical protein